MYYLLIVNKGADLAAPQLTVPLFSHLHDKAASHDEGYL